MDPDNIVNARLAIKAKTGLAVRWLWHDTNSWTLELIDGRKINLPRVSSWRDQTMLSDFVADQVHFNLRRLPRMEWSHVVNDLFLLIQETQQRKLFEELPKVT